ncbi:alanine--tRNA ligase [Iris pallida]|uniref:Alanine--tRNA ligase n=1 Tax=Iris pallida TaxID=29817 RepID=A0AAX6GSZ6_IRIPA|nr:alanine--tRNA ligase [Iris pallida]
MIGSRVNIFFLHGNSLIQESNLRIIVKLEYFQSSPTLTAWSRSVDRRISTG